MASTQRTTALLREAGFADVRTEEVSVQFAVPDAEEYLTFVADAAGPLAMAVRGLRDAERDALRDDLEQSLTLFCDRGRVQPPGGGPLCGGVLSRTSLSGAMAEATPACLGFSAGDAMSDGPEA